MQKMYRIGFEKTKGKNRKYLSVNETGEDFESVKRDDALHWPKKVAKILVKRLNDENVRQGNSERLQIEKA